MKNIEEVLECLQNNNVKHIDYEINLGSGKLFELQKSLLSLNMNHNVYDVSYIRNINDISFILTDSVIIIDMYDKIDNDFKLEFDKYVDSLPNKVIFMHIIKECSFNDIKFGLIVKDELGRIGKIVANDDIENIKVLLDRNQTEYYSLLVEKLYFV